jgi:CheY-like chemotaxis protein
VKPYLVFIDDDPHELADLGSIASDTYEYEPIKWPHEGPIRLSRIPDLFVLDMYFPTPGSPSAIPNADLNAQKQRASEIAAGFAALYENAVEPRDLLRQTFACIREGYDLLWSQCEALGQTAENGRRLLAGIRADRRFAEVPIVFYSRKATVEDAVLALQAGAFAVIPKVASPPSKQAREAVLAQFEAARHRFADLSKGGTPANFNVTLLQEEIVAQKLEFTIAKMGS